ncbi:MAG TPA: zf-HC2 domain-containing protein [Blastocatellia bacterium]|nr:zf-HC2 domain-containing protein [Blastocatellia bacterium]
MNTQNNCNMHEALMSYLYDESTPDEKLRVETHLTDCGACKQELHAFERVRGMLQQWQLDDSPVVRIVTEQDRGKRSILAVLRELITVTPIWAKALSAVAMAMLVLAVLGTDVSVGRGGISLHADLLRRNRSVEPANAGGQQNPMSSDRASIEQVRAEMKSLVNQLVAERESEQKEQIKAELASLQLQLQNVHSADLAKVLSRIQEQQTRLKTIERDIDRREGLDLTDILFSEVSKPAERSTSGGD